MDNFVSINSTTWMKWKIPWKTQIPKPTQEEIGKLNNPVCIKYIDLIVKHFFFKEDAMPSWLHWWNLPHISKRNNNSAQPLPKN